MVTSSISTENWVATVVAGVGIGLLGIWKYLKEPKSSTSPTGDRIVLGLTIADMQPILDLAAEQARTTAANERIADAWKRCSNSRASGPPMKRSCAAPRSWRSRC